MNESNRDFDEVIRTIQKDDPRYEKGAYYFVRQALDFSLKNLHKRGKLDQSNHLSGPQLLDGIRLYAIKEFGPMARFVLENWGVRNCQDFGNIVFNLVDCKVLGKTEKDSPDDFSGGYSFRAAFDQPFRPQQIKPTIKRPPAR
jgi:uncharacterized repeat protein (TIGR04138 family)